MTIETVPATVKTSLEEVHTFLTNPANFEQLLAKDNIRDFKSSPEYCEFKASGGIHFTLVLKEKEFPKVVYVSDSQSQFSYVLTAFLSGSDTETTAHMVFEAQVNSFVKMMIEKPLTQLFERIKTELENKFNS